MVSQRFLVATWDGAGNLEPILALVVALTRRGHNVSVLGHDVQRSRIEATGVTFIAFETAPQLDQGRPETWGADPLAIFVSFIERSATDMLAVAERLDPAALLVDCMMPDALRAAKHAGYPTAALVHSTYSALAGDMDGRFIAPIGRADLALAFSYAAFDDGAYPPTLSFVGPVRPDPPATSWKRRHPGRPFVAVSLSTGVQGSHAMQVDLLQRACDAVADIEVEAIVTTGRGIAPDELSVGPNTSAERHVPHDVILPQADLLVTHAGHGSVMAAMRFGVPMLCVPPPRSDQPANAANVARLGLGEAFDWQSSSDILRAGVLRLLDEGALHERSRAFAASVAAAPGIERAVALVEALCASRGGGSTKSRRAGGSPKAEA